MHTIKFRHKNFYKADTLKLKNSSVLYVLLKALPPVCMKYTA